MNRSSIILAGFIGLFGGACVGYLSISGSPVALARNEVQTSTASSDGPKSAVSDFGGNVRIARFFTALDEPVELKRRAELFDALRACTSKDLPGLMVRVQALPHDARWNLLPMVIERWFQLDVAEAREWVRGNRDWVGMLALAKADPRSVIQEAISNPNSPYVSNVLGAAIAEIAPGDPAAQAAALAKIPAGELRNRTLRGLISMWLGKDPAFAYASIDQLPPGRERDQAHSAVLCEWAERDPNAAIAQMDTLLPTLKAGVLGNELTIKFAEKIGAKDSKLALNWISKLPAEFRVAPAIGVARTWASKEPEAALDWCMENGVDIARGHRDGFRGWQAGVLGEAMAAKPEATISWLQTLPPGMDRDRLLERGLADALWRAPKDVLFAGEDPLLMQFFREVSEDGQIRLASRVAEERVKLGGLTDLGAWVQNFPSGATRAKAISGAIGAAYERDATTIEPLLASVSSGADRDVALGALVKVTINDAPAAAATRALAISDEARRREALDLAVTSWQKRDPAASRAWLEENSSIPAPWKAKWLQGP